MINIVLPVLNEELRIRKGLDKLLEFLNDNSDIKSEITIVDNGSYDATHDIIKEYENKYEQISSIRIEERGVGIAFKTAVENNYCDIIGYMDIDMSTDLSALRKTYSIFESDTEVDIVNASRYNKKSELIGRKWYRNIVSYVFLLILKGVFKMKSTDAICGFKFFKANCIERLLAESEEEPGWFLLIEVLLRAERENYNICELPVKWTYDTNTKVNIVKVTRNYLSQIFRLSRVIDK